MKLSKDQVQFIDTYLINNEVIYVDIRKEMLDHIALAVEQKMELENQDFYKSFKEYMLVNKKEFLKSNLKYINIASHKAGSVLLYNLFKPLSLSLYIILYIHFYLIANYSEFDYNIFFQVMNFFLIFSLATTYLYKTFSKNEKYSVTNSILGLYCMLNYLPNTVFRVQYLIHNNNILFIYYALFLGIGIVTYFTYKSILNNYKTKYIL